MIQHLTEHLSLWYVTTVFEKAREALDGRDPSEFMKIKDQEVAAEFDRTLAMVSMEVLSQDTQKLKTLPPIIQRAHEMIAKFQQASQPMDPAQVMHEKNQMTAQDNQQKNALKTQELEQRKNDANIRAVIDGTKIKTDVQKEQLRSQTQRELSHADNLSEAARLQLKEQAENRRTEQTNATKLEANRDDNMTALSIAKAEIENQEPTDLSTGAGINPGTNQ
jgi:hypothetical protein